MPRKCVYEKRRNIGVLGETLARVTLAVGLTKFLVKTIIFVFLKVLILLWTQVSQVFDAATNT